ncbi:unnamed protein product [Hydatigera taeniaeformis]|uniref:CLP1_P domain-containing protein n=1 Tax=Hydatigena taeniaeformis TaxID=6205 RepID=A0A0R3X7I8_HYDTA|nr:unnamed protein product [Hydatigera taeniaeformis]
MSSDDVVPAAKCSANDHFLRKGDATFIKLQDLPATWLCLLPPKSSWVIYGRSKITLLQKSVVEIFGAHIKNVSSLAVSVYAPSTQVPIDLRTPSTCDVSSNESLSDLVSELANVTSLSQEYLWNRLNDLFTSSADLSHFAAIVLLQPLPCPVIESITKMRCFRNLFSHPICDLTTDKLTVGGDTYSIESASADEGFVESSEMIHFFERNSGKSTLIRRLVNRLLSLGGFGAVAVLDFDPGQSEFTPSGMLSLTIIKNFILGPPFSHALSGLFRPTRQCFYGGTTPSVNPTFYVECLRYVIGDFKECIKAQCPVIVNTMGWTQGKSPIGSAGFASSQDQRDLTLLGHLLSDLVGAETSLPGSGPSGRGGMPLGHPTAHLLDCIPYKVPLTLSEKPEAGRPLAIHLLHQYSGNADTTLYNLPGLANCLNATLVALCSVPQEKIIPPTELGGLTLLSQMPPCECLGFAVVRALNPDSGFIYLTTGVPLEELTRVNAIIRGKVNLPHSLFTEQPLTTEALLSYPTQRQPRPPYLGTDYPIGSGRTGLPTRRHHPRVMHHSPTSLRNSAQL